MICVQFVFRPGRYDDEFHRLDSAIDDYARSLPGFVATETWTAEDATLVNRIIVSDVRATYGDGRLPGPATADSSDASA